MIKDREKLLSHVGDPIQVEALKRVLDKIESCIKNYTVEHTDFLDPYQRKLAESVLNRFDQISYSFEGGYDGAERKSIVIYPDYLLYEQVICPISAIEIRGNFKFNRSSHSDYLGSIMGKGIKREKIGDILAHEDRAFVIISADISEYIIANLDRIGKESVKVSNIEFENIEVPDEEFKEKIITTSSERLDCLISEIYDISRTKAASLVDSDRVKVNFQPINNKSKLITEKSMISIRGLGRSFIYEYLGDSRKGKLRFKVLKY